MTPLSPHRTLTIVIPCLNDAELLRDCLASINAQTIAPDEIIVVDNGSTDNSVQIAEEAGATVVHEARRGITWASAAGYNAAGGEVIVRIDADCTLHPDYLARIHETWDRALLDTTSSSKTASSKTVVALTGVGSFDLPGQLGERIADFYLGAYRWASRQALGHNPIFGSNCSISRTWWEEVRDDIDLSNTFVHEDMYFSFFVRPHETVWFQKDLTVMMDPRALYGAKQVWTRVARGFHTVRSAWELEPVYIRLVRRGVVNASIIPSQLLPRDLKPPLA
ncbi:Putative glycosyltransferase EpsH [Corynebacterium faecale]|uniref:glycosyltransferase family 2 protein n=1 Tax=Corynebacterium faecale TaxID=1758466 RepID=UPI0025B58D03|nr:glycosyltransferase family 2 protein [Corynebacterium faecale]WJY91402.1 Putative glycosyltransferase EpsH [Corynebacterium faecale]